MRLPGRLSFRRSSLERTREQELQEREASCRSDDEQGDPAAAYELGKLLADRGELKEAEAAYGRADERGHPTAAAQLGMLMQSHGDTAGALAAYRRADERSDGLGALRLGLLLAERGDWDQAKAAFSRAEQRGHAADELDLAPALRPRAVSDLAPAAHRTAFANPVLVGAVTVLVVIVAVFLAYNANKGLPFVPTRELKVDIGDGSNLVPGNDVLEGGHRIGFVSQLKPVGLGNGTTGAQLTLKMSKNEGKIPVDSRVTVRLRSVLGSKYVDITKGTSNHPFGDGATMPVSQTNVPVQLDQVFDIFNPPTRAAVQQDLVGFGDTFAARGGDLNLTVQSLPALLQHLAPVAAYLSAPPTGLTTFLDSLNAFTGAVSPVSATLVNLVRDSATTFGAISNNSGNLAATIAKSPSTLSVSTTSLTVQQPFLADLTTFGRYLTPAAASLKGALPNINPALEAGSETLRQTPVLNQKLQQVMNQVKSLALDPGTNVALNGLIATVNQLNPMVRYLGPYQTVCDYWNYTWTDLSDTVSEPTAFGTGQRAMFMSANPLQPNNPAAQPASQKVNGNAPGGDANPLGGNIYFHSPVYGAAVDNSGAADCETGQRGYPRQLNYFDPQHRLFDTDQHTPGNQGPTYAGRTHVPAGETFSRDPQSGPQTPYNPTNP